MADDLVNAAKILQSLTELDYSQMLLYCMAIEVGLKASLLNNNNTQMARNANKNKLGHNLEEIVENAGKNDAILLTSDEVDQIKLANTFFKSKSLEYCSEELIGAMVLGGAGLPDVKTLAAIAEKVQAMIVSNSFFVHSSTT